MEGKIKKLLAQIELLRNFGSNTKKAGSANITIGFLDGRRELLHKYWDNYVKLNDQISYAADDSSFDSAQAYVDAELLFSIALGEINEHVRQLTPNTSQASPLHESSLNHSAIHNHNVDVKLPKICIPKFSGDYSAWTSFCDIFTSLVGHNNSLSNVQKLYHLKSSLSGSAEALLRQFAVTEDNFDPAWNLLKRRFANKRLLLNAQFDRLLSQQKLTSNSPSGLKRVLDTSLECINSINGIINAEVRYDALLLHIITQKLDLKTHEAWELSVRGSEEPASMDEFIKFLEESYRSMELVLPPSKGIVESYNQYGNRSKRLDGRSVHSHHTSAKASPRNNSVTCAMCNEDHVLYTCKRFKDLSVDDRSKFVTEHKLCIGCLSSTHTVSNCISKRACVVCNQHHNTLLHSSKMSNPFASPSTSSPSASTSTVHTHHLVAHQDRQALLPTALVQIQSSTDQWHTYRALLDQGSQASFITQSAVAFLRLTTNKLITSVRGLGNTDAQVSKSIASFTFKSIYDDIEFHADAVVLSKLTSLLPSSLIKCASWPHIQDLRLADPNFLQPSKIDLVIGADLFADLLMSGIIKGEPGTPVAQETTLGWIISGRADPMDKSFDIETPSAEIISCHCNTSIDDQLQRFWSIEELGDVPQPSNSDLFCETQFKNTHSRSPTGMYTVRLPFDKNEDLPEFGLSFKRALSRLQNMEKRFERDPKLKEQYATFMEEYLSLGHMRPITPSEEIDRKSFFLPHHAVFKDSSTTTKVRVVFDASCKSSNGLSLNDRLLAGPILQQDLMDILLRWRKHRVAVTADVEKMFRQILVTPEHRPYQRILWRDSAGQLTVYELNTVTYGTACASYLSIRVIMQLAEDEKDNYPLSQSKIMTDMYVDDLLSGGDTKEEAVELQRQAIELFKKGGFTLRKWASNENDVVQSVPETYREQSNSLDVGKAESIKTLGIHWRPDSDTFFFKVHMSNETLALNKRNLLSDVSRIYDPLGWLSPVVVRAKMLFQSLWLRGINWDDPLPDDIRQEWTTLRDKLATLETLVIPRWTGFTSEIKLVEYHGFCDASLKAYAAVIYSRIEVGDQFIITLLAAKTRVSPLKQISLPNLELCGAALLSKLLKRVSNAMGIKNYKCYAWTDSTIVLSWLRSTSHKKVFVANRVTCILENTTPPDWRHVKSHENPADIASRGICPTKFEAFSLWWNGPHWLKQREDSWSPTNEKIPELITSEIFTASTTITTNETYKFMLNKYSTLQKLLRVTALCMRFHRNCQTKIVNRETSFISALEIRAAMDTWLKLVQSNDFHAEISSLAHKSASSLPSSSRIISLNPFVCSDGFLRVGGRLQNAKLLHYDMKNPILLDRHNPFTKLIIRKAHVDTTLHGGATITLAAIRTRFWIINARTAIRSCIHQCVVCHRHSAVTKSQIMASLPESRVTPSKVFSHSGVDYAGPFDVRMSKHRGKGTVKAYVCMFVCFSTKAVHVELVSDMTAVNFIAAFKRFVSRRGACSNLYSDCGTNFVGANKILVAQNRKAEKQWMCEIGEKLADKGTKWHFIAPGSPHFGGLWEASIKSLKFHLKRIIGSLVLTYEELYTALTQIEATLNSRPLCPLSNDPSDTIALTPGHFLVGCPLFAVPEPSMLEVASNRLTRWQLVEKIHQDLWHSWSRDYLHELHQRPKKWSKTQANITIGDLVLVKDDRTAPGLWPLARVVDVHPGKDGQVRVATIQHKNGITKRPIVKLSLLPKNDPEI